MQAMVVEDWCEPKDMVLRRAAGPASRAGAGGDRRQGHRLQLLRHPDGAGQVPGEAAAAVLAGRRGGGRGARRRRRASAASRSATACSPCSAAAGSPSVALAPAAGRVQDARLRCRSSTARPSASSTRPRTSASSTAPTCSRARRCSCTPRPAASASRRCRSARRSARASSRPRARRASWTVARQHGADEAFDYSTPDWVEQVKAGHRRPRRRRHLRSGRRRHLRPLHSSASPSAAACWSSASPRGTHPRRPGQPHPAEEHRDRRPALGRLPPARSRQDPAGDGASCSSSTSAAR